MTKGGVAACVVAWVVWQARPAYAFPSSRLTYSRASTAASCPDETAVRQAVRSRLGYDPFFPSADKTIVARIERISHELRGSIELIDEHGIVRGRREFKMPANQCDELTATMALAISIAIDPSSQASDPAPEPASNALPAARASAPIPSDPEAARIVDAPRESSSSVSGVRVLPGLFVTRSLGAAPDTAFGFGISLGMRYRIMSLSLEGRREFPASSDVASGSVQTSLWLASLVPCLHVESIFVCACGSLGSLQGGGVGLARSHQESVVYELLGVRAGLETHLSPALMLRAYLDVLAPLTPVDLVIDGTPVWSTSSVSGLLGLGLAANIP